MKHAYLITAHNNFEVLKYSLSLIDDSRNAVFLLIDRKTRQVDIEALRTVIQHAPLILLPRKRINWGGQSQIQAELALLEAAVMYPDHFSYYHYLQGADLPVKTQDDIHRFFNQRPDAEYIDFNPVNYEFSKYKRNYYHWLVDNRFYRTNRLFRILNHSLARLQKMLGINRRSIGTLYHGSALFSITDRLARYIVDQKKKLLHDYRHTLACDEVFIQTLVMKSEFSSNIHQFERSCYGNTRLIDWSRSKQRNSPYTFTLADYDELIALDSEICYARKFDENKDIEIVRRLYHTIMAQNGALKNSSSG